MVNVVAEKLELNSLVGWSSKAKFKSNSLIFPILYLKKQYN